MPIYNRNSVGDVSVVANESYGYADMGRILSECVANDMILFNTVIRNDFKENTAIREGTMVASEIQALREFSVKEAWGGLKEKLKKLWEKIKGVFKKVYAQLTVWLVRNGKAFVAMHRKTLATKTGLKDIKLPECYTSNANYEKASKAYERLEARTNEFINSHKTVSNENFDVDTLTNTMVGGGLGLLGEGGITADNAVEKTIELCFDKHEKGSTFGSLGINYTEFLDNISTSSSAIKDIRKADSEADKAIKKAISDLEKAAKNEKQDTDASKELSKKYQNASKACSAFERSITIVTKVNIKIVKYKLSNSRKIIGALVGGGIKEDAELALMEAGEAIREMDEIEGTPEEVADAIEDAKEDGVDIEINVNDCGD